MSNVTLREQQAGITTIDGTIDAWICHPAGEGSWPAVILHTDIRGVREVFREMGRHIAAAGYFVLLPNLFYRVAREPVLDPGLSLQDEAGRARVAELRAGLGPDELRRDHAVLLGWLPTRPQVISGRTAIVGYCFSGAVALQAAADFPEHIVAAASFHGGRLATDAADSPHRRATDIRARLHFGHAENDASMPEDAITLLEETLTRAGVTFSQRRHAARHGFTVADSAAYDAVEADQHWQDLLHLLDTTLHNTLAMANPAAIAASPH